MDAFVLDASMTAAWHFRDEETPITEAVERMTLDRAVVVPRHWFAEMANTLLVGERRKRAGFADSVRFIDRLADLMLVVDDLEGMDLMTRILPLARAHGLTVYDAMYLEVAERRGLALASLDTELCAAARGVGVEVVVDTL